MTGVIDLRVLSLWVAVGTAEAPKCHRTGAGKGYGKRLLSLGLDAKSTTCLQALWRNASALNTLSSLTITDKGCWFGKELVPPLNRPTRVCVGYRGQTCRR